MTNKIRNKANLVQLVKGDDLEPLYTFDNNSISFRQPAEKNSVLEFYSYEDDWNVNKVKNLAVRTFEENHDKLLFVDSSMRLFEGWDYLIKNIDELKELELKQKEELDLVSLKNWYNPFSKRFWQRGGEYFAFKLTTNSVGSLLLGEGIYGLVKGDTTGLFAIGSGVLAFMMSAVSRAITKDNKKRELETISKNIEYYDNFKENIEKADIKIYSPKEAKEIRGELESLRDFGKHIKPDVNAANKDLLEIYRNFN